MGWLGHFLSSAPSGQSAKDRLPVAKALYWLVAVGVVFIRIECFWFAWVALRDSLGVWFRNSHTPFSFLSCLRRAIA